MTIGRVLIAGASVAGVGLANELRRYGFKGSIMLVDCQEHMPYDRPPLSKSALLDAAADAGLAFHETGHYERLGIELRLSTRIAALDAPGMTLLPESGEPLTGDAIVIATGARARSFPTELTDTPIATLRDLGDAVALRRVLRPGTSLAVIGGGFIGAEVASSACKAGLAVTIIEAMEMPFLRVMGREVAQELISLHRQAGVSLHCGVTVERIWRDAAGRHCLELSDGGAVEAELVVAGLGALPNVEWLASSGLETRNGVVCDSRGLTSAPGIYAAGDVASWLNPRTGMHERHEHWTSAREQARIIAGEIAGDSSRRWYDFVPYFWSDMHGKRIQLLGTAGAAAAVSIAYRDPAKGAFLAEYRRDGRLQGVAGCNAGARIMRYLPQLEAAPTTSA